jgi:chorismate mutase / prephenate dehydratase
VTDDRVVRELRAQIDELDRAIFAAVNRRIDLVAQLKRHKDEHGISFVDAGREEQMLAERERENTGPLSVEGLRSFYAALLALCKRELGD